jgi:hypothetical protein
MDGVIQYLNTDLDLKSADDFTPLAKYLESCGLCLLHVTKGDDDRWHAIVEPASDESEADHEPERDIADMLSVIEALPADLQAQWLACQLRDFNIGYNCGKTPWAFNQGLSTGLLARLAAVQASLRVTIYPEERLD